VTAPPGAGALLLDGRYRVGAAIARGGMSTVHRGTDIRLDRPVAIKIMDPGLAADPAFRARFEREARSAARIDHPAVVDVHDQGEHAGDAAQPVVFLVMELVEGGTLRDVLRERGPLGVPAAVAVLEPVLAGLAQAHRLGMVHRDVKPENVLIGHGGEVKVADFGLVTAAAQAGSSHVGMILGTVAYLSPEQVTTGSADARSDVYAAGILLYELLTGTPPYTGDTAISVAYRHVNGDVPAPSAVAGDVPPELDEIVAVATRRDASARYGDAEVMLTALRRAAHRLGVPRVPPPRAAVPARAARSAEPAAGPRGTRAMPRAEPAATAGPPVPGPPPAGPTAPGHRRARRPGRRAFLAWVAVVLVLGLLVASAAWWLATGRWTAVPSVVGLDRVAAEQLLARAELVPAVSEMPDDRVAAGAVATTVPAGEVRVLRGSEVRVVVSLGRPEVPAIAPGTPVAAAEDAVRGSSLTPVRATDAAEFSDSVPEGTVLRTDPPAGTALAVGAPVTLVVSRGVRPAPARVVVPLVIGDRADDAAEDLAELGLRVEIEEGFPFGDRDGVVVDQAPDPGTPVPPGTTVVLSTAGF